MNHSFDIEHAKEYGLPEAIILQNVLFWLAHNKAFNRNIRNGVPWTFNSVSAYSRLFPYWTKDKIRRYFDSLEDQKVLIAGNFNKKRYDKTKWHTVANQDLIPVYGEPLANSPMAKMPNGLGENAKPIPDINTDENNISAADFIKSPFGQEKKKTKIRKPVKTLNIPEIESLLNIMEKTGIKMSTISANLKMQMLHAVELHGLEFCESALRGRIIQAAQQAKPLYLPTLFDPENGQWLNDCANIFEAQEKKVIVLHSMTDPDIDNLMSEMQAAWKAQ